MCGLKGSSGKKGCSESVCSATCAVAILAADLVVVVIGLVAERRVRGRRREETLSIEAMSEAVFVPGRWRGGVVVVSGLL